VPATDDASNEKLVRDTLLVDAAANAQFLSTYAADTTPAERCRALDAALPALPLPFACTLLGMGGDGHIASLFPDAGNLAAGLDENNPAWCLPVTTSASEHVRISLTLAALLQSMQIVLLFFGTGKRDVYERAKAASSAYPVASLLSQDRTPVHVFWAA
jgi:6-phosphogluconolactonase